MCLFKNHTQSRKIIDLKSLMITQKLVYEHQTRFVLNQKSLWKDHCKKQPTIFTTQLSKAKEGLKNPILGIDPLWNRHGEYQVILHCNFSVECSLYYFNNKSINSYNDCYYYKK